MVFSSFVFLWIFLPVVSLGYFICLKISERRGNNILPNLLLLFASILFYAWGEPVYVVLMLLSVVVNWVAGIGISRTRYRKLILLLAIVCNLGMLMWFKYAGMFVQTVNTVFGVNIPYTELPLPVGISFYTFQALSYVVDVYRKECEAQRNILKLGLFISFFPQLIAGPIVKYKDIAAQIDHRVVTKDGLAEGIRRFSYGLAKKVLIANTLAVPVDAIYALQSSEVSWYMAWLAAILYTLQIYYDFSGYSDMAIGLAKMFGFDLNENFNYPYLSLSVREFWRRWHISLGKWFQDYVYVPLGGSRCGKWKTYRNLWIVFFLTGLWHGASWTFVLWGLVHGLFMFIERLGFEGVLKKHKIFAFFYTFLFVNFAWVLFRADNIRQAGAFLKRMILPFLYTQNAYSVWEFLDMRTLFIFILGIVGMGIIQMPRKKQGLRSKWKDSVAETIFIPVIFFLSLIALAGNTYNPFIYFRF